MKDAIDAAAQTQDPKELVCEMYEKTQLHYATLRYGHYQVSKWVAKF